MAVWQVLIKILPYSENKIRPKILNHHSIYLFEEHKKKVLPEYGLVTASHEIILACK